tara:strand:+ start:2484 stop:4091 length:1608 start_codon:yes stop_codon:yes gene_type:complete
MPESGRPRSSKDTFSHNLNFLADQKVNPLLRRIQRGIEKEGLRTTLTGELAQSAHPIGLGSALTNSWLTTDFSESLLEFITPVFDSIDETLVYLDTTHALAYQQMNDEIIWGASMPCILPTDKHIPIAQYGRSNVATMKTVYRRGLGHRYGRAMQTVAGIHYNFSLPETFWRHAFEHDKCNGQTEHKYLQHYIDQRYFDLIRNFRRYYWLLIYLFGAAPCADKSFVQERHHDLQSLSENDIYKPFATSLRMGDLGYQSSAQNALYVCYNTLQSYADTINKALRTPYPDYQKFADPVNGEHQQLSSSMLQIENEFYSAIRPKQVARSGETPIKALTQRGVEYIEIRCLDISPFSPRGIDDTTIRFLDAFLLYCLTSESPPSNPKEYELIALNQERIVNYGRKPGLNVLCGGQELPMQKCANNMLDQIHDIATELDNAHGGTHYTETVIAQREKVSDSALTPSARVLAKMDESKASHIQFNLAQATSHADYFSALNIDTHQQESLMSIARHSVEQQEGLEQEDDVDFSTFLADYFNQ